MWLYNLLLKPQKAKRFENVAFDNGIKTSKIHGRPPCSWKIFFGKNTARLDGRGQRETEMKGGFQTTQILLTASRLKKPLSFKHKEEGSLRE